VKTGSGTHPTICRKGVWDSFSVGKVAVAWSWLLICT